MARFSVPHVGGVERQWYLLGELLTAAGFRVEQLTTTPHGRGGNGVSMVVAPGWAVSWGTTGLAIWYGLGLLRRCLRRPCPVVITARVSLESAIACVLAPLLRLHTIVFLVGGEAAGSEFSLQRRRWVRRAILRRATVIVAHDEALLLEVQRAGARGRTLRIPTLVPREDDRSGCRWHLQPSELPTLIWCGRDDPVKNVAALEELVDSGELAGCRVVAILDQEPARPLSTGVVSHFSCPNPRHHFRHATLHISTSLFEGQSNVLAEAAMEGVPTVAFDVGGTRTILADLGFGEVVAVEDGVPALAAATMRVVAYWSSSAQDELRARAAAIFWDRASALWLSAVIGRTTR